MPYTIMPNGSVLSIQLTAVDERHELMRSYERGTTAPTVLVTGLRWACTNSSTLSSLTGSQVGGPWSEAMVRYDGSVWVLESDPRYPALNAGGTVKAAADLDLNSHKIINLADASAAGHAVPARQLSRYDGVYAFIDAVTQKDSGGGDWQRVNAVAADTASRFTPRRVVVRLYGDVEVVGGSVIGSIDQTLTYDRWEGSGSFGGTSGRTVIATLTVGTDTVEVAIEPVFTAGDNGFYLELYKTNGTPAYCTVEVAEAQCYGGIGH